MCIRDLKFDKAHEIKMHIEDLFIASKFSSIRFFTFFVSMQHSEVYLGLKRFAFSKSKSSHHTMLLQSIFQIVIHDLTYFLALKAIH